MPYDRSFFLKPAQPKHRQYEALRAIIVDDMPVAEVAERIGYSPRSLYNLLRRFQREPGGFKFFNESKPGRRPGAKTPLRERRTRRILELRKRQQLPVTAIRRQLKREGILAGTTTIAKTIREAGLPKLPRRTAKERAAARAERAPAADRAQLDLTPRRFQTQFGGLFLFAFDLVRMNLDGMLKDCQFPGSRQIPAGCAVRTLLALKLWGIGRPRHLMPDILDEGIALFAGLNVAPKKSTLSAYSSGVDSDRTPQLMTAWHSALRNVGVELGGGVSFDLDFHTIPYHGDRALIEKHYVSKRSRRQRGVLAFLARDADGRYFDYANTKIRKEDQNDEVLRFVQHWYERTGRYPTELVFDSRLTTYANLAVLNKKGIRFLTLRRRSKTLVNSIRALPNDQWRRIRLNNIGRRYRTPRVAVQHVYLSKYKDTVRQIAVTDLGHDKPTLLITNDRVTKPATLIDRYARRMIIENTIADAIDFFHMDALSAAVPLKIDLDMQLTIMASTLYRVLARRVAGGRENQKSRTLFRDLVKYGAFISIDPEGILVRMRRRANSITMRKAGYDNATMRIPWLNNLPLTIRFD